MVMKLQSVGGHAFEIRRRNIKGGRSHNEDSFETLTLENEGKRFHLHAVADGLGGHASGELASGVARENLKGVVEEAQGVGLESGDILVQNSGISISKEIISKNIVRFFKNGAQDLEPIILGDVCALGFIKLKSISISAKDAQEKFCSMWVKNMLPSWR